MTELTTTDKQKLNQEGKDENGEDIEPIYEYVLKLQKRIKAIEDKLGL